MEIDWIPGGHVYRERQTGQWVALSYVRVLGRFDSRAEAVRAVTEEAKKYTEEMQDE